MGHTVGMVRRQALNGGGDARPDGMDLGRDHEGAGQAHEQRHQQAGAPEPDGTDQILFHLCDPAADPAQPCETEDNPGRPVQAAEDEARDVPGHVPAGKLPEEDRRREEAEAQGGARPKEQDGLGEAVKAAEQIGVHGILETEDSPHHSL